MFKRSLLSLVLVSFSFTTFCQDQFSFQKRDIGLSMNAAPILDFMLNSSNIGNNTGQTAETPGFTSSFPQTFVGRYFLDDKTALRMYVGLKSLSSDTTTYFNLTPTDEIFETNKVNEFDFTLGLGIEKRKSTSRLQGFIGSEIFLLINSVKNKNKFGLIYNVTNETAGNIIGGDSRILKDKLIRYGVGARAFVGIEYFVVPRISIGTELGWSFAVLFQPRRTTTTEYWDDIDLDLINGRRVTKERGTSNSGSFEIAVDNGSATFTGGSAALNVNFYF